MMEHAKLLTDAREWASIDASDDRKGILIALADLVERLERRENTIRTVLKECDAFNAELVAACVACDREISELLSCSPDVWGSALWNRLRAARHRAQRAVKLAEPKGDVPQTDEERLSEAGAQADFEARVVNDVDATLAEATAKYGNLLQRLAGIGDTTNQPPDGPANSLPLGVTDMPDRTEPSAPPPDWDRWHELLDIKAKRVLNPAEYDEYKRLSEIAEHLDAEEGQAAGAALDNLAKRCSKPPPPVEVEMRTVDSTEKNDTPVWVWYCWLLGTAVEPTIAGPKRHRETEPEARLNAEEWLAALGAKLGVQLVADWKDSE